MKRIAKTSALLLVMTIVMSSCSRKGIGCPNNLGKVPQPHTTEKTV